MLIIGTSIEVIKLTKDFLNSKFEIKDLGEVDLILGVKVKKSKYGFSLNQIHYVENVLRNLIILM